MFYLVCSVFLNWVCWVRGNFSGELGHVYSVCVSPLCGVPGRYKLIWAFLGAGGGTVQVSWLCNGGYGTVEMVKGLVRLFCFLQFTDSSLGGWMSAVRIFVLYILNFLIFLQVVSSQSELGRGPGASA
jgi:hypothetical protein